MFITSVNSGSVKRVPVIETREGIFDECSINTVGGWVADTLELTSFCEVTSFTIGLKVLDNF